MLPERDAAAVRALLVKSAQRWVRSDSQAEGDRPVDPTDPAQAGRSGPSGAHRRRFQWRHWFVRLLPVLAFAGYFYFALIEPSTKPTRAITPEIEIDASSPIAPEVPASAVAASAASTSVSAPVAASEPALPSSMTALLQNWYAKLASPPTRLWGLHPAGWLLLLLATAALVYRVTRARTEFLARLRTREVLREQHLHVPAPAARRLGGACRDDVRAAAHLLRRPQGSAKAAATPGAPLDVTATVRASARAGGRFVPVAKGQRVARRLVVLIDRARPGEPLALLMARLTQALADEGVAVVTRHFDRDPRRALRPGAQPGEVLVLCSDGRGLLDARDGALRPWLAREVGQAWPLRVLLTPVPVASWGAAEDRLAGEGGFVVLPAVSWALPALARRVVSAQDGRAEAALELPFVHGAPARWPGLLRGQALRWLSPTLPAEEDVAALLRQLRGLLGARGFGWLAAGAAYPQLSLPLAEHLAAQWDDAEVKDDDARLREAQWLALAHLPWLRQGWMPDWLRRALLRELPVAQRDRLGEALRVLLRQDGAGGLDMGRIATAYQRRWFTRWLGRGEPAGSPLRDVIYLGLLDGRIDELLALPVEATLARRMHRQLIGSTAVTKSETTATSAVPVSAPPVPASSTRSDKTLVNTLLGTPLPASNAHTGLLILVPAVLMLLYGFLVEPSFATYLIEWPGMVIVASCVGWILWKANQRLAVSTHHSHLPASAVPPVSVERPAALPATLALGIEVQLLSVGLDPIVQTLRPGQTLVVGCSSETADLSIPNELLSGRHVSISVGSDGAFELCDLGSLNHTYERHIENGTSDWRRIQFSIGTQGGFMLGPPQDGGVLLELRQISLAL